MYLSNETFDEAVLRVNVYFLKLMATIVLLTLNTLYNEI